MEIYCQGNSSDPLTIANRNGAIASNMPPPAISSVVNPEQKVGFEMSGIDEGAMHVRAGVEAAIDGLVLVAIGA